MSSLVDELRNLTKSFRKTQRLSAVDHRYAAWRNKFITSEFFGSLKYQAELGSYNMVVKCETDEDLAYFARWCYEHGFQWNEEVRVISWASQEYERNEKLITSKFEK